MTPTRGVLRVQRGLARHWGVAVLLTCGAVLRSAATVAYRPALVYIDTPRYLGHNERGLDPLGYRYLLLKPLLAPHAGLAGVAIAQHLLGLLIGVTIYALVISHAAPRWLAASAAAPVLLDAYQVQAEQAVMPDVLFEALLVAALAILAWPPARKNARLRIAGAALVLGVAATVRQVGELTVIPLAAYALAATPVAGASVARTPAARTTGTRTTGARTTGARNAAARTAAAKATGALTALVAFAVPVVGYMALSATVLGTGFRLSDMDDAYLYARVAHAADCAALRLPEYERPLCPAGSALGVDALATGTSSPVYAYKPPPGVARGAAITGFDKAVLTQQALRVAAGVARDAVKVFALTRDSAPGDPPVARWQFQASYPVYAEADREAAVAPRADAALAAALRWYQLHGGFTPGPFLLALLISGTASAASPRTARPLRLTAAIGIALALATVGGADLYEFSWRYQLPALVTLSPAGALGALALARGAVAARSPGGGRMNRCTRIRLTRPSQRSGRSAAASSTPTPGSGSARTKSSDPTDPAARTPSSSGTTSP